MGLDDFDTDAAADRFCDGYFAHKRGEPRPTEPDAAAGWDERAASLGVRVIMPARPEGYYHQRLED